jgi:histidinol phosphatase-like enzyme
LIIIEYIPKKLKRKCEHKPLLNKGVVKVINNSTVQQGAGKGYREHTSGTQSENLVQVILSITRACLDEGYFCVSFSIQFKLELTLPKLSTEKPPVQVPPYGDLFI